MAKGARQTWQSIVRVMALVWATSRKLTLALAGATLLQSITPAAQVWLAGRLIDEVVAGVQAGGGDQHIRAIVVLAVLQLGPAPRLQLPADRRQHQPAAAAGAAGHPRPAPDHAPRRHAGSGRLRERRLLRPAAASAARIGAATGADGLRRLRARPLHRHLRHHGRAPPGAVALGGGGRADRPHPGLHLRLPLRLVGVPADAAAVAGAARHVLPHDPDDDRRVREGSEALHGRRLLHRPLRADRGRLLRGDAPAPRAPLPGRLRLGLADDAGLLRHLPLCRAAGGARAGDAGSIDRLHPGGGPGAGRLPGDPGRHPGHLRERALPLDALRAAGAGAAHPRAGAPGAGPPPLPAGDRVPQRQLPLSRTGKRWRWTTSPSPSSRGRPSPWSDATAPASRRS